MSPCLRTSVGLSLGTLSFLFPMIFLSFSLKKENKQILLNKGNHTINIVSCEFLKNITAHFINKCLPCIPLTEILQSMLTGGESLGMIIWYTDLN